MKIGPEHVGYIALWGDTGMGTVMGMDSDHVVIGTTDGRVSKARREILALVDPAEVEEAAAAARKKVLWDRRAAALKATKPDGSPAVATTPPAS